ncbi:MAG: hypothetical protein KF784_08125 [Fimbriimonadaceae bacterium]|nr:hypothetical protein [Fimbriimonadaceae bacterium]
MRARLFPFVVAMMLSAGAQAAFTITLDQPNLVAPLPGSDTVYYFTGTATRDVGGTESWSYTMYSAMLPNVTDPIDGAFLPTPFMDWIASGSLNYAGDIFGVTIKPTNQIGMHDFNPDTDPSPRVLYGFMDESENWHESNPLYFTVNVTEPVPEPASAAVLGLGLLPFLRRRRLKKA